MKEKKVRIRFRDLPREKKKTFFKELFSRFTLDMGLFHGAALSFYLIFTMIPLLYLAINVLGAIVGKSTITEVINQFLIEHFGISDFSGIFSFLETIDFGGDNIIFRNIGIIVLLVSSSAIFIALKTSVNYFYGIQPSFDSGKKKFLVNLVSRLISIGLLSGMGILLMIAYFVQVFFISFGSKLLAGSQMMSKFWLNFTQIGITFLCIAFFLTIVYKYLNDAVVKFRVAFVGAVIASILLLIGQYGINYYLNYVYFGKSGSVISVILILLAFVYYGSQAIFIGASASAAYGEVTEQPILTKYMKRI